MKWLYFQIIFSIKSWTKWASFIFLHILSNIVVKCNVGPLTQNQEECFVWRKYKEKNKNKCLKCKSALLPGHLTSYLFNFSTNFWVYHYFHVFKDFRKLNSIWNYVFWCPWHPRTSSEWSLIKLANFMFFMKTIIFSMFFRFPAAWFNPKSCFLMPLTSQNIIGMILDKIGKLHFFHEYSHFGAPTKINKISIVP